MERDRRAFIREGVLRLDSVKLMDSHISHNELLFRKHKGTPIEIVNQHLWLRVQHLFVDQAWMSFWTCWWFEHVYIYQTR